MTGRSIRHFVVVPERSALLVTARSNVGPIEFGTTDLTGSISLAFDGAVPAYDDGTAAHVSVRVDRLSSGNRVYDAELWRRIDARRFPAATVDLTGAPSPDGDGVLHLAGEVAFHGVRRLVNGTVSARVGADGLVVDGRHAFDIRNFEVATPSLLMLKVYPDVTLDLHVEAEVAAGTD